MSKTQARFLIFLMAMAFISVVVAACSQPEASEEDETPAAANSFPIEVPTGDQLTQGQSLYNQHCAECHGENGEGEQPDPYAPGAAPPHDTTGHTWHHPDQANLATVLNGGATMPAFSEKLSPDEVMLILGYIKTWWGENELDVQRQRTEAFSATP